MGLSEEDLKDPAVKFIADHLGKSERKLSALEGQLQQREQAEQQARAEWGLNSARHGIDGFADEKAKDGRPLRPYFDAVLPYIIDLYKANPNRDLAETYDAACWAHPEVRKQLLQAEQFRHQSQNDIAEGPACTARQHAGAHDPCRAAQRCGRAFQGLHQRCDRTFCR